MAVIDIDLGRPAFSRRQALKIVAATAAVPLAIGGVRYFAPDARFFTWSGVSMGGLASLSIWHTDAKFAQQTITRMISEVNRLESVFSLYQAGSEILRLNADGALPVASTDLRTVLDMARLMGNASGGAFDVSVQPLWNLYADHFSAPGADPAGPPADALRRVLPLIDYSRIETAGPRVTLGAGMSITLNSIGQGYITDRIADLLRNEGFDHVIAELGETRVLGNQPDGQPWVVGIRDHTGLAPNQMELSNQGLAVSGGYGTVFTPNGESHHIFNPDTGRSADGVTTVAVRADRAMLANGLSTAGIVVGEDRLPGLLAQFPGTGALIVRGDGTTRSF